MGILDTVLGGLMGGNASSSPLRPILAELLSGQQASGSQGGTQPGLMGLVERFTQAGHGDAVNSWIGNGANQPVAPSALQNVFGQDQISQWSQQTGMAPHDLLGQLSQFLPNAISSMTPNGQLPTSAEHQAGSSAFDGPGTASL